MSFSSSSDGSQATATSDPGAVASSRILDATEALLEHRHFDDVGFDDIAAEIGAPVDAVRAEVGDKRALLSALQNRLYEGVAETLERELDPERFEGASLEDRVVHVAQLGAALHAGRLGAIRAVVVASRSDQAFRRRAHDFNAWLMKVVTDLFLGARDEVSHPNPEEAVRVAVLVAESYLRERLLFQDLWEGLAPPAGPELADHVVDAVMGVLTRRRTEEP